jgi:hypothetical protein
MIYLEEVLSRVFADSTTKAVKANNNIMVSCDKDYYLPLYICDKKNVKLPSFDVMINDTYTFFKDLSINYVAQTDDGSVYMVLSFKCYNDGTVLYEDFYEMFPTDTIISIEDYKTHENEFLYFNYDFDFTYNKKVRVS